MAFQPARPKSAPSGVGKAIYASYLSSRDVTELLLPGPNAAAVSKAFAVCVECVCLCICIFVCVCMCMSVSKVFATCIEEGGTGDNARGG